ncbi:type II toxin-antitoxin system VapC family toxin [Thiothrix fructosivorans]|uniref:Type II toxin-antitoxin system VapC family toxin n=1 Tax=Thiothrix fructosivorans TaxID=111770 RepID=A0A8B0SDG9_9GAMM|nr:type II toxin-antitoxin system VapC family toxin [Thiothrix fructosivorans]MBO0614555.1 type II toxin-antitoxin system VapC family toxin [Thiothrix fructosivorans]QTX09386.1 type II toxin-antitoxin system VapC family toxin [Thiothrix fructosivorans]
MIGLDTNILARYYIEDEDDKEATHQRLAAQRLIESGKPLMVAKTVMLEFEWVMRGYYHFEAAEIVTVFKHLLTLPQITLEERNVVEQAIASFEQGLDFADALHHASYRDCEAMASFDDRKFARRAKRLGLVPRVIVPQ